MKRIISSLFVAGLALGAWAQGTFTIRRPENGANVRETVKVRIPRSSIPTGGYVGIWINDKFVEAIAPQDKDDVEDGMFIYSLNTKERGLSDGKLKIEAGLYTPFSAEAARITNKSSVTVTLDNHSSIKPPTGGFLLRYNFKPGRELVYQIQQSVGRSTLTEAQAKMGARANEQTGDGETLRYLIAFERAEKNGAQGLVRVQAMPVLGKDFAVLTTTSSQTPKKYYRDQMSPLYMMLTNTGHEVFGRAPYYFGMEGTAGRVTPLDLFAVLPMPALPPRGVQVGDSWSATLTIPAMGDPGELYEAAKLTKPAPARGTLEGIEYQNGERCAHVRNVIAVNSGPDGAQSQQEENFWISLDRGILLKTETVITRTVRIKADAAGAASGMGGPSGTGGMPPGVPGGPGGRPGMNGRGGDNGGDFSIGQGAVDLKQQGRKQGGPGGMGRRGGGPSGMGASAPGGGNGGGMTTNRSAGTKIVRERIAFTMTLERVIH